MTDRTAPSRERQPRRRRRAAASSSSGSRARCTSAPARSLEGAISTRSTERVGPDTQAVVLRLKRARNPDAVGMSILSSAVDRWRGARGRGRAHAAFARACARASENCRPRAEARPGTRLPRAARCGGRARCSRSTHAYEYVTDLYRPARKRLGPRPSARSVLRDLSAGWHERKGHLLRCSLAPGGWSLTCRALGEVRRNSATPPRSLPRALASRPFEQPAGRASCAWWGQSLRSRPINLILRSASRNSKLARLGRRTVLTFPLLPPPQKNRSPPSDSSPDTSTPGGISSVSRTSPVRGSTRRRSLSSPSQVPCQSSPSTQVTPVTKRLDSIVRRIAPVWGST